MDLPADSGRLAAAGRALRAAAWPLLLSAAVLLLVSPVLLTDRTLASRDSLREYAPLRPGIAEALHQGRLPLWDAHDGAGVPLFAQLLHGVLHPASVALALTAPGAPLDALLLAYLLLAALGAYAAARALEVAPPAAAAAALGYAGSGAVLGSTANLLLLAGAASLPWLLAAGVRCGKGGRFGGVALALATATTLLSGDLHAVVVGAVLAVALALHVGGWRALPKVVAGLLVGALLAAVQLLPSWRFLGLTARTLQLTPAVQAQWALSPWRLPELVAPGFFGGRPGVDAPLVFQALEPGSQYAMPFAASVFVGSALLAAALAAISAPRARPLLVAAPLLLWLALGHRLFAQQLLQGVPIWGSLRYAEKLVGPLTLVLALLASLGLSRLAERSPLRLVLALAAAAGLLTGLLALPATGEPLVGAWLPASAVAAGRGQAVTGLLQLTLGLGALAALLALARRSPRAFAPAFAALVLVEALLAVPFAFPGGPPDMPLPPVPPAPPPGARLLTPERRILPPGTPDAADEGLRDEAALGFPGYNVAARVENVDVYTGLVPLRFEQVWGMLDGFPEGWRRYGVTHVVLSAGPQGEVGRAAIRGGTFLGADRRIQLWAVPHRPWASFAARVQAIPDAARALDATAAAIQTGRELVTVEADGPLPVADGRVLAVEKRAESLTVEAEADGPAVLVIAEAWWPGWVATLDGAPCEILPADVLLRAVRFPAGRHRLELRYAPPEVRHGLWLSALGLALLLGLAAWEARSQDGQSSTPASPVG